MAANAYPLVIVDCGGANLASVSNSLNRLGIDHKISDRPEDVLAADRLLLPGVGAAGTVLAGLRSRHLDLALDEAVRTKATPFLGICVGMQVMAETLEEFGVHRGLSWIKGRVIHLSALGYASRIPHMGWSRVEATPGGLPLMTTVRGDKQFYFCHSFALSTSDDDVVAARTVAELGLVAAVRTGSAWGVQFHPEKSHLNGERLLTAFCEWSP